MDPRAPRDAGEAPEARPSAPKPFAPLWTRCTDTGTVVAGDVTNTLMTPARLHERQMDGVVFYELLGFNAPSPMTVREAWRRIDDVKKDVHDSRVAYSVAAHAPYSVSPALFAEIARQRRDAPLAVPG